MACKAPKAASSLAEKLSTRCKETVAAESVLGFIVNAWALVGSILICVALYRNVRLRTVANMYILSFALIDFLMALLVMPFSLGVIMKGEWISTASACQFQGYMILVLGCLTMLTMTLMAIDRYFATVRPVQYTYFFKRKYVGVVIALCWFLAFAVSLGYSMSGRAYAFHPGIAACGMDLSQGDTTYKPASLLELFFVVIPLFVIAVCYWRVHAKIGSNHERKMTLFDDEEDVTKLSAGIVVSVLIFWWPYFLVNIIDALTSQYSLPRSLYFVCSLCIGISCCIKPLMLYIFDVDFKAELKRILTFRRTRRVADGKAGTAKNTANKMENPKGAPEKRRYLLNDEPRKENRSYDIVQVHHDIGKPKPKRTPEGKEAVFLGGEQPFEVEKLQEVDTRPTDSPQIVDSNRFFLDEETDGRESRLKTSDKQQQATKGGPAGLPPIRGVVFEDKVEENHRPENNGVYLLTEEKPQRKKKYRKKRSDTVIPSRKVLSNV